MTSFLKKFQILKKKDTRNNESLPQSTRGKPESSFQPSTSQDPASKRTTQLLPLLVKSSPSPASAEAKKKAQPQPVVLPELVQRTANIQSTSANSRADDRRGPRAPAETAKEQIVLPKLFRKEKPKKASTPSEKKKPMPTGPAPLYPELSDEHFRFLWDSKKLPRGRPVRESLEMMSEREILDTIFIYLYQSLPIPVYRYFGTKLRDSRHKDVVSEYLHMLLGFSAQDEVDREGVSETIRVVAFCHLPEILGVLRDYGHLVPSRKATQPEVIPEETRNATERQIRTTLILCYGQAALGAKPEDMLMLVDFIVAEILYQFRGTNKDETMKRIFMRSVIMISKALLQSKKENVEFPHKSELVICIIEVIEEEPSGSFSITILHQAMITVTCMTPLKPPLDSEVRSELVSKSVKKVFSLPSLKVTKLKAGMPMHPIQTQDFYHQTVVACHNMLTGLLSEAPNLESLQDILIHTNSWIDSPKNYERERAIRGTSHLLKFASEHLEFDTSQEFSLLGQLVALLGLHIADSVKEVGQVAAEAMYHLHYIIMSKMAKAMEKKRRNKKGNIVKWYREDFFIPGPSIFYNNLSKVAKAFGEHLSTNQVTDLSLKTISSLTHEDKAISQAAGVLLSSFLEECGMDLEDLPIIVKEIYSHLMNVNDPVTKEETLKAVCSLASKRLNGVVDVLLECSVECDDTVAEIWKALVADPYCSIKLMRPLLKRLQDEDPLSEVTYRRHSKSIMPMAATNALCLILSLPDAADTLQNKFSHLLIALVTQIYFVLGTGRRSSKRPSIPTDTLLHPSPLSTTLQALKNLIACAGYIKEYNIMGMQGCWEMLSTPENYFEGIFKLVRILFVFSKYHLKMTFKQANAYLRRPDAKERAVGMAFFTELLSYSEISLFFVKQDILEVLREWMVQPNPLMQVFSIRGLGHLLQHPLEDEILEPLLPPLISCASDPDWNIGKESIKTLQHMFQHLDVNEFGYTGTGLIPRLVMHFSDDDHELRAASVALFAILLKGVDENSRNSVVEDVLRGFVPLLILLADPCSREAARKALFSCADFMKWVDLPQNLFNYEIYENLYVTYLNICKYIVCNYKSKFPEMLAQMVDYLRSRNASFREAGAILIASNAQIMKSNVVSTEQVENVFLALRELQGDCDAAVANAAVESIEEVFRHCGQRISPQIVPSQLMLLLKNNMAKRPFETSKN
ncbi:maestro heat-like repeat family member 5 [Pogona vitticeps]